MNIEKTIIEYLNEQFDESVHSDAPEKRPGSFITVERTGGDLNNVVMDHAVLAVQSWDKRGRYYASELAEKVDTALLKADIMNVTKIERNGLYNFPAPSCFRYQGVYEITYYKEEI